MAEGENQEGVQRLKLLKYWTKTGLSYDILLPMIQCMRGKTDKEKDQIAEKLLRIIESSDSEEEMLKRAAEELK